MGRTSIHTVWPTASKANTVALALYAVDIVFDVFTLRLCVAMDVLQNEDGNERDVLR